MTHGHAQATLESKEGAERAREDFAQGITVNPFGRRSGWRRMAWDGQMQALVNRRDCIAADHDRSKCCWQHEYHLVRWSKSFRGITSCTFCQGEADAERERRAPADAPVPAFA